MNRRGFLHGLAGFTAGLALDPEKLLWVPGKKTIFIPPARDWLYATAYWDDSPLQTVAVLNRLLTPEEMRFLYNEGRGLKFADLVTPGGGS